MVPADWTLVLLLEPGVDALLVMHVHARQQPHFFTFGERQQTNTEADSCVTAANTAAQGRKSVGRACSPALRIFAGRAGVNVFGLDERSAMAVQGALRDVHHRIATVTSRRRKSLQVRKKEV